MIDEKKKMTTQDSSVGADDGQSISKNSDISITTFKEEINDEVVNPQESLEEMYRKIQRMSDPAYLHTVTLDELMDNVFEVKSAVIENLLYTGAYMSMVDQKMELLQSELDEWEMKKKALMQLLLTGIVRVKP